MSAHIPQALKAKQDFEALLSDAKKGSVEANLKIGMHYLENVKVRADLLEAIDHLKKAAYKNNAAAQYLLGFCNEQGLGLKRNMRKAIVYYNLAVSKDLPSAINKLHALYKSGQLDRDEAFLYFVAAAKKGSADACYEVARCYTQGVGIKKDPKKALEWYQKAADKKHAGAQYLIGSCYEDGIGVNRDMRKAVQYYLLALNQNLPGSLEKMETLRSERLLNPGETLEYFLTAAKQGLPIAQYELGRVYEARGTPKDFKHAFEWYQKAAENPEDYSIKAKAEIKLARAYHHGRGVSVHLPKAMEHYRKVIDLLEQHPEKFINDWLRGQLRGAANEGIGRLTSGYTTKKENEKPNLQQPPQAPQPPRRPRPPIF